MTSITWSVTRHGNILCMIGSLRSQRSKHKIVHQAEDDEVEQVKHNLIVRLKRVKNSHRFTSTSCNSSHFLKDSYQTQQYNFETLQIEQKSRNNVRLNLDVTTLLSQHVWFYLSFAANACRWGKLSVHQAHRLYRWYWEIQLQRQLRPFSNSWPEWAARSISSANTISTKVEVWAVTSPRVDVAYCSGTLSTETRSIRSSRLRELKLKLKHEQPTSTSKT